ncbi:MAG: L-lactate permease [Collinsella sp.]
MITSLSRDRRVLALLVAWCFGGFMEGMSGFGTAVAIPAGMLAALGFPPLQAVLVCLVANGVPTCFGSVGVPTVSLAGLTGLDPIQLAFTDDVADRPLLRHRAFHHRHDRGGACERCLGKAWPGRPSARCGYDRSGFRRRVCAAVAGGRRLCRPRASRSWSVRCAPCSSPRMLARRQKTVAPEFEMHVDAAEHVTPRRALRAWSCFILIFVLLLLTSKLVPAANAWLCSVLERRHDL